MFRNVDSAVYLRANERNRANLERVAAYYAREGIPFDPQRGFDALRVLRTSPRWAMTHGLVPADWGALVADARFAARARRATVYALLGCYEQAAAIDRDLLQEALRSLRAARRLTWSLLHAGSREERLDAADRLAALATPGTLAHALARAARELPALDTEAARSIVATLPMFTEREQQETLAAFWAPPARRARQNSPSGRE